MLPSRKSGDSSSSKRSDANDNQGDQTPTVRKSLSPEKVTQGSSGGIPVDNRRQSIDNALKAHGLQIFGVNSGSNSGPEQTISRSAVTSAQPFEDASGSLFLSDKDNTRLILGAKVNVEYARGYITKMQHDNYIKIIKSDPELLLLYERGEKLANSEWWLGFTGDDLINDAKEFTRVCECYGKIAGIPLQKLLSHAMTTVNKINTDTAEVDHCKVAAGYASIAHEIIKKHISTLGSGSPGEDLTAQETPQSSRSDQASPAYASQDHPPCLTHYPTLNDWTSNQDSYTYLFPFKDRFLQPLTKQVKIATRVLTAARRITPR
jgi:hypothetical protein